ncbi:MAG: ABC1 kinase family protein [Sporichthyaceae bacterium]
MEPRTPKPISGGRVARVAPLVGLAGRTAGEAVVASLRKDKHSSGAEARHARNADRYVQRLGQSRGVLMKAGQILSMVIPESTVDGDYRGVYQRAFAKLFDDGPPMPTDVAIATIEAELGRRLPEVFASFDPKPLAAASIGQVHAATLHNGTRVAVKVQYPGVEQAIRADLANTELVGTFLRLLLSAFPKAGRMDVAALTQEIADRIGEEIDYLAEARNQREFAEAYRGHPFIRIPEVHDELTTRRVLTMQFVDGMRYAEAKSADRALRDQWGEAIYRFVFDSLARLGLNNADAHPGNYLFHPDGSITCLDFGCVKRFTPAEVAWILGIFRAVAARDTGALHQACTAAGFLAAADAPSPEDLMAWWADSAPYLTAPQPFTMTPEYITEAYQASLKGPHKRVLYKLTTPASFTMVTRLGTGTFSMLGGLHATGDWTAIRENCCHAGPPTTTYGRSDTEFWAAKS